MTADVKRGVAMRSLPILLAACCLYALPGQAIAQSLKDLADQCDMAVSSENKSAFSEISGKLKKRQDVFDTAVRTRIEDCLSIGYGEPWEYDWPSGSFMSSSAVAAKLQAAKDEKARKARAATAAAKAEADLQAAKDRNAARVAQLVYSSCATLLLDDQVAAMTNQLCVESFLANGLPEP